MLDLFGNKKKEQGLGIQKPIFKKDSQQAKNDRKAQRRSIWGAVGTAMVHASTVFFMDMYAYMQDYRKDEQGNLDLHRFVEENNYDLVYQSRKDAFALNRKGISPFIMMVHKAVMQSDAYYLPIISDILQDSSAEDLNQQFGRSFKFEIGVQTNPEITGELKETVLHALAKLTIEADLTFAQQITLRVLLDALIKKGANTAQLNSDGMTASHLISASEKYRNLSDWFAKDVLGTEVVFVQQAINRLSNLSHALDVIDMVLNPSGTPSIVSDMLDDLEPLVRKLKSTDQATFLRSIDVLIEYNQDVGLYLGANRNIVAELSKIFESEVNGPLFNHSEPTVEEIIEDEHQPAVVFSNINEISGDHFVEINEVDVDLNISTKHTLSH